jgi:thioredoxin domain-containing protein 5
MSRCGHCKRLAPTWDELAEKFSGTGIVTIAKVDCTEETSLCADHGVRGYPTLKLFREVDNVTPYQGARDLENLFQFVMETVAGAAQQQETESKSEEEPEPKAAAEVERDEHGLLHLTDANFNDVINNKEGVLFVKLYAPWCGHCKRLAPVWEQLGERYRDNDHVEIVKVDCTVEKKTCQRYEVRGYPTLILIADSIVLEKYSGSRAFDDLVQFVEDNRIDN